MAGPESRSGCVGEQGMGVRDRGRVFFEGETRIGCNIETHLSCGAVGAVILTGARGPEDMIEHLPFHVGGNHHSLDPQGSRPMLDWRPGPHKYINTSCSPC